MQRMIRVRFTGKSEVKEMTITEAKQMVEDTYSDGLGGLVVDTKTGMAIPQLSDRIEDITIIQMLGGG